jgi:plastocyanin
MKNTVKKLALFGAAMFLVAAVATACGGSGTTEKTSSATATATASPTASAPATAGAATITIAKMNFGEPVTVSPGAQVAIKNGDSVEHSVTSDTSGQFNVDVEANQGGTLTAPSAPGEYKFHCTYHPSMHGTLTVK